MPYPITLYFADKGTTQLATNPIYHACMKHIEVSYHFVQDLLPMVLFVSYLFLQNLKLQISSPKDFYPFLITKFALSYSGYLPINLQVCDMRFC